MLAILCFFFNLDNKHVQLYFATRFSHLSAKVAPEMPKNVDLDDFCKFSLFFTYDVIASTYMECWHFVWYGWIDEGLSFYDCRVLNNEFPERVIVIPLGKICSKTYLGRTRDKTLD